MAKCPLCGKNKPHKQDIIDHIEKEHTSEIPSDMSTAQFIYSLNHGRDYGLCRVCGNKTDWNEKTGKPKQLCNNPACKAKRRKIAQRNMIKIYGTDTLLTDPLHQEKMLANRKISGTYTWSDHTHKFVYTGSYEKFALEWLDKVMDYDPECIVMPGPIVYYDFKGEKKPWITDMYLPELNLVIEFKDGSFDKNTHEGFAPNREREAAKDNHMKHQSQYNYTKITNKNMMSLVKVIAEIRLQNIFSEEKPKKTEPVVVIHESTEYKENLTPANYLNNSDLFSLCESIHNESVMSVANLSPIATTGKFEELKESPLNQDANDLENSTMMFGDGIHSSVVDSNHQGFKTESVEDDSLSLLDRLTAIKKGKITEAGVDGDQMFSNHEKGTWNPLDSSDNFREIDESGKSPSREDEEVNPSVRTDVETDPTSYGENDLSKIADDIYSSNFETK